MLQLHLLGGFDLSTAAGERVVLSGRSARNLVAYLALKPDRLIPRERVAGTIWPDRTDRAAQKELRNALWRIRCALSGGPELVSVQAGRVGMADTVWIDAREFRSLLPEPAASDGRGLSGDQVSRLEAALPLYRGDLLEGFDEHWVSGPRETLRLLHQNALEQLVLHYRSEGDLRRAILRGRELVRKNPFLEHVHRELMLCHWARGDRPMAIRQYRRCERILRRELDLEPMDETRELLERIRTGSVPRDPGRGRGEAVG